MSRKIDITGKQFGYYTVNSFYGMKGSKGKESAYWNVTCKCGNTNIVNGSLLRRNEAMSCGCRMRELNTIRNTKPAEVTNFVKHYYSYKSGAVKRNLDFTLTKQEFGQLVSQPCHYCKAEPSASKDGSYKGQFFVNGIDRMNNYEGYNITNVVPCCAICNRAKREMGYDEFIEWIDRLVAARTK